MNNEGLSEEMVKEAGIKDLVMKPFSPHNFLKLFVVY